MTDYVLSRYGIHKFVPNGNGGGKETTELQDQDFVKQHGMHWYDFTVPDACACSVKK